MGGNGIFNRRCRIYRGPYKRASFDLFKYFDLVVGLESVGFMEISTTFTPMVVYSNSSFKHIRDCGNTVSVFRRQELFSQN